jgi:thymidylate synthase (FAD)
MKKSKNKSRKKMKMKKNDLIGKEFKVLDKGFVRLVDVMGSDEAVVQAARVSYGKGTKTRHEDEGLIRYLLRHRHTTPFEQCELKFHVKVPMDAWRQWIRHRTASVNEYSTRYSEAIDDKQETKSDKWRLQDKTKNLQGSSGFLHEAYDDENGGDYLTLRERELHELSEVVYKERLNLGIAREQARKDLPLSTYTMSYWKIDLHNLLHFLSLRMDSHAQLEIREYATTIGNEIVAKLFPLTWGAFQDYRLNAINLTARDIEMIKQINSVVQDGELYLDSFMKSNGLGSNLFGWFDRKKDGTLKNNLERMEFEDKAKRLGIEIPWL